MAGEVLDRPAIARRAFLKIAGATTLMTAACTTSASQEVDCAPFEDSPSHRRLAELTQRFVTVNGYRIAVYEAGQGPAVLLIHGIPDSAVTWRYQVPVLLNAGYRVIALDLLGAGDSDRVACLSAFERQHELAAAWAAVDSAGIDKLHAVIGHDRGAPIGWIMAAQSPERVERLVALSVGHPSSFADQDMQQRRRQWHALRFQFDDAEDFLRADDWHNFREWMEFHPDCHDWITDLSRPGGLISMLNFYRAILNPMNRPRGALGSVSVPTTGIWSDGDPFLLERQMAGSDRFVTGPWKFVRIEGAGHFLQIDKPDEVNTAILTALGT